MTCPSTWRGLQCHVSSPHLGLHFAKVGAVTYGWRATDASSRNDHAVTS